MPYVTHCEECGTPIAYDVPDEILCPKCGWTEEDPNEEVPGWGGLDRETVDAYLRAMEKDD